MIDAADVGISSCDDDPRTSPGVYFLFSGQRLVYVGQAHNVVSRVAEHCKDKSFSRSAFVPMLRGDLDFVESYLICFLRPMLNKKIPVLGYRNQYTRGRISIKAKSFVSQVIEGIPRPDAIRLFAEEMARLNAMRMRASGWKKRRYSQLIERNIAFMRRVIGRDAEAVNVR